MSKKLTREEFIERARKVHGDKYDYSKVEYKSMNDKVEIICPAHGSFWQLASNHLGGHGCPNCHYDETKKRKTYTTQDFIQKARKVHGDKYDYSKVIYESCYKAVTIICPVHGEFLQSPAKHLSGHGCHKCAITKKDDFIERARRIHGNKFDYSNVEFEKLSDKIQIICPKHGLFWQKASAHLYGTGCPRCRYEKIDTGIFIKRASEKHNGKYDYSLVEYHRSDEKVRILCPIHGEFLQTPNKHLLGQGCPKCRNEQTSQRCKAAKKNESKPKKEPITIEHYRDEFIKKAIAKYGALFDYSNIDYHGTDTPIKLKCDKHGEFSCTPYRHLHGQVCPVCTKEILFKKQSTPYDEFLQRARKKFGDKYGYDKSTYVNLNTKMRIICPVHGEFWMHPNKHLVGQGCKHCTQSILEIETKTFLLDHKIVLDEQKKFDWLVNDKTGMKLSIDFFLPDYNIGIECQGGQHFRYIPIYGTKETFERVVYRDKLKFNLCKEHGIEILYFTNERKYPSSYMNDIYTNLEELLSKILGNGT